MAETEKYKISNFQAAAQLGALVGEIQGLLIIEPRPDRAVFVKLLYDLEILAEMADELSNAIKELISHEQ